MKKVAAAILLFDLTVGLLFLGLWEQKENGAVAASGDTVTVHDTDSAEGTAYEIEERAEEAALGDQMEDVLKIALTFDDGPHPYYTEELLDGLKERGVVATFFVTGEHAALHPEVIQRMHEDA